MTYTLVTPVKVTKELILSKITEENIMEHYLGIPVNKKGKFCSPLRKDNNPTCTYYRSKGGRLFFRDWSGAFYGDCFEVVMYKFNCSYYMSLQIIANDFGLVSRPKLAVNPPLTEYTNETFEETGSAVIEVEIKDFDQHELNYWLQYGINKKTLNKFKVFSCKNVWLNGNIYHFYRDKQLVFGYYGGIKDNVEQWRIYFPTKRKYKFISNWKSKQLQGVFSHLKKGGKHLVITKSLKDCMTLYEYGIPAIAPISETIFVERRQYEKLKEKFDNIILFYDNDLPGISSMNKIRKKFDVDIMFIPRKFGVKDISDFRKKYGFQKTKDLIEQTKLLIDGKSKKGE